MNQMMKTEYIQPEISIMTVCGKEVVMQNQGVIAGSKGTPASGGNGEEPDDAKGRGMDFEEKEITYGNIW